MLIGHIVADDTLPRDFHAFGDAGLLLDRLLAGVPRI
jgi:hypothetical protein